MVEWILIITFIYSNNISSQVIIFPTQESCIQAGKDSIDLASKVRFSCVPRPVSKGVK